MGRHRHPTGVLVSIWVAAVVIAGGGPVGVTMAMDLDGLTGDPDGGVWACDVRHGLVVRFVEARGRKRPTYPVADFQPFKSCHRSKG